MDDSNSRLRAKLKVSEAKEAHVRSELADLKGHLRRQTQESEVLRGEVAKLKRILTVQLLLLPQFHRAALSVGCLPASCQVLLCVALAALVTPLWRADSPIL